MSTKTKWIIVLAILGIAGYFGYQYIYHDHRDISSEEATITVSSEKILQLFQQEENTDILNKTVEVSGIVTEIDLNTITLDKSIHCSFESLPAEVQLQKQITIKGRCIGYDDLFEMVKLDQCSIQ